MKPSPSARYQFEAFRVEARARRLLRDEVPIPLPRKAFDVLLALLEKEGAVATKEELLERVWKDAFVEENNLNQAVSSIRRALGDTPELRRFVETVSGVGYRFCCPVRRLDTESDTVASAPAAPLQVGSLAVLPFQFLDGQAEGFGWGLGMADTLITRLTRLRHTIIRPTGSIAGYAGGAVDWMEAGRRLGVDALVLGAVRRSGDRLRVTVQLVRVEDGSAVWAEKFDETSKDVFELEDSIAERVARTISLELSPEDRNGLARRPTKSPQAHRLYLEARHLSTRLNRDGFQRAVQLLHEAVRIDPGFALAYEGLAFYHTQAVDLIIPPQEAMPAAREAALRALTLDPGLAEGHVALGSVLFLFDWKFEEGLAEFHEALRLNPQLEHAHRILAFALAFLGRAGQALEVIDRLLKINPLSLENRLYEVVVQFFVGRSDESLERARRLVEVDPQFWLAHASLGRCLLACGQVEEAISAFLEARRLEDAIPELWGDLGRAYGVAGRTEDARTVLDELKARAAYRHIPPYIQAQVHAGIQDREASLERLERAFEQKSWYMAWLLADPAWDFMRDDPRFQGLMRRVGFPD